MTKERIPSEDSKLAKNKRGSQMRPEKSRSEWKDRALAALQRKIGNKAVQRLIQRESGEGFEIDPETAGRIERERSGGQPLEPSLNEQAAAAMEQDFDDVQIHTSAESADLNQELGAKAFTSGKDIFFGEGAYDPHSSSGKELIAHELTHVVQQTSGEVTHSGPMRVNPPGDRFEQEADQVAKTLSQSDAPTQAQRQEEEEVQLQPMEEEEEMLQMQPLEEEEEELQMQPLEEEEEMIQAQTEEEEEEEELMP
jgi:hypothetical protein